MKRLFKRIISSVIVSITVLNILLPIIPEGILDVNAAYIGHTDETGETMYTFSSKLKELEICHNMMKKEAGPIIMASMEWLTY